MEAGDEGDGKESLRVHLPPQEEVSLQVVEAEVVLTAGGDTHTHTHAHQDVFNTSQKHQSIRNMLS